MINIALPETALVHNGLKRLKSPWGIILTIPFAVALLDPGNLSNILKTSSSALFGTLPYIAIAVTLIAGLKATGSTTLVALAFEGRENRMIVLAALFGGLAPFCSCEVIPFVAALLAAGTPLSAVMAFWLSSPLIDPSTMLIAAAALGWDFAIAKAVSAVALGLFGGFGIKLIAQTKAFSSPLRADAPTGCRSCDGPAQKETLLWKFWREAPRVATFRSEAVSSVVFLIKWITLAYLIEALLISYVPADLIAGVVGSDGFASIVIGALVGAPAYLNGYAAPALVAGLIEQGMTWGAGMSFTVAGSISSFPAMVAVWSLVRRPVFGAYLAFGIAGAILCGLAFAAYAG